MKKILISILLLVCFGQLFAQKSYGNEWINFSQEYYKIETARNGLFKLDQSYFSSSGIDISSVDPRNIQLFHRGKEVPIIVEGEEDGTFDTGDRILFLGKQNDGVLDSSLYFSGAQPHQHYNLMVDTTAYFLTWNNETGKRIENVNHSSAGSTKNSRIIEDLKVFTDVYLFGEERASFIFYSEFDYGEGWFSKVITKGNSLDYNFTDIESVISDSLELDLMLVGANKFDHQCQIKVGNYVKNLQSFSGYRTLNQTIKIPTSEVSSNSLTIELHVIGTADADAVSIGFYNLKYETSKLLLNNNMNFFKTSGTSFNDYKLDGLKENYLLDITDEYDVKRISVTEVGTAGEFTYEGNQKLLLAPENSLFTPQQAKTVTFIEEDLSAKFLLITHTEFMNACVDYKAYRESTVGGGLSTILADVNRLYDQYNYGERSPIAIKNLVHYLYDNGAPEYLFLVSMGRVVSMQNGNKPFARKLPFHNNFYGSKNYVPTMGNPGSDLLYSTGLLTTNKYEPALATGRLSIWNPSQMGIYLNKVKEFESQNNISYRKKALHLSGGKTEQEKNQFLQFMDGFTDSFQQPSIGGSVKTLSKKSADEVEFMNVSKEINDGVAIVNSFSHSSAYVTGIDIGDLSNEVNGYDNKGKYPIIYINGCHSGDAYNVKNDADDWLFSTADKGAINWIAHSSYGYSTYLNIYTDLFYKYLFNEDETWGSPIGEVHKRTIREFMNKPGFESNQIALSHASQFHVQGDPSISIFKYDDPDFSISNAFLTSNNETPISAASDSIKINIVLTNLSKAIDDSLDLCISRSSNGIDYSYDNQRIKSPYFEDTLTLVLPNNESAIGLNEFSITVNCSQELAEVDSTNNTFNFSYFFNENVVLPLLPYEFSIVNTNKVNFIGQSANRDIKGKQSYILELDTSLEFNSTLHTSTLSDFIYPTFNDVNLPITIDSTIYYWRVGIVLDTDTNWSSSSFTYMKNGQGFSQTNFNQFYKGDFNNISRIKDLQKWAYDSVYTLVDAQSGGEAISSHWKNSWVRVDGQSIILQGKRGNCTPDGVYLLTFDKVTGLPYNINGLDNGSCGNRPRIAESFPNETQYKSGARLNQLSIQNQLKDYIENTKDGDYILLVSVGNAYYDTWDISLKNAIESIGAQLLDQLSNKEPYILLGKKGFSELEYEERGSSASSIINIFQNLAGQFDQASVTSPLIGPALEWNSFYRSIDSSKADTYDFEIIGIDKQSNESVLLSAVGNELDSLSMAQIDAQLYPYLKLSSTLVDTVNLTPAQLNNWGISYTPAPEGVILYNLINEKFLSTDLEFTQGENDKLGIWFKNVSSTNYESDIEVVYLIRNTEFGQVVNDTFKVSGPTSLDSVFFEIPITGELGINELSVYVNFNSIPEQNYSNNFFSSTFTVIPDFNQFILDVTFDGIHIQNRDIVAKRPLIEINAFNDYADYSIMDSTSLKVFIKNMNCDTCDYVPVYFNSPELTLNETSNASMNVYYTPQNLNDGIYGLKLVDSRDATKSYQIEFSIESEFSITNIELYPNPAIDYINIDFKLTGETVPDSFKLHVYSSNGTLIGVLNDQNLEFLRVGHNNISFSTLNFASGIYIYILEVENGGDVYIQKGKFSKL